MSFRIESTTNQLVENKPNPINQKIDRSFQSFLKESLQTQTPSTEMKISNHAQKRMEERGIELNQSDLNSIEGAVEELNQKGSKNALIVYKNMAFITSINNRTIITAMHTDEMETITNIDSMKKINN
ncbi:TIGR02530 family flagellar biosynthesis protein [Carnobacterium inhibens]|uniref:Flagellar biosynthesis protein n=1 Tax=Carnobacterium inhibens subsp. gilichinskyi TaxID=1266845 RepID=U5SBA9_9LACT|nr:TIGR02530 family flagellar biosynthesis protein [Carnobacterium inhibens]AGY82341.1 flagellar biosynthesis protein [Carnobacterium inhibens subsp. gilichinskyi]